MEIEFNSIFFNIIHGNSKEYLYYAFERIDELIKEGFDINSSIQDEHGDENHILSHILSEFHYRDCLFPEEKEYMDEIFYFLSERVVPVEKSILEFQSCMTDYKILEEFLKRFDKKISYNEYIRYCPNYHSSYLEVILGFSCLDINHKFNYIKAYQKNGFTFYCNHRILPLEASIIDLVYLLTKGDEIFRDEYRQNEGVYGENGYIDEIDEELYIDCEKKMLYEEIVNYITFFKRYGKFEPSYLKIANILNEMFDDDNIFKYNLKKSLEYYESL
jgi:hypothetical protein